MIRRSFRRSLSNAIPSHYQGAIYTLVSGIVLLVFVVFWQNPGTILLKADGPIRYVLRVIFFLSIFGMLWGLWALRSVDMFGLSPILKNIGAAPIQETPFSIRGPYRWVRHPLYLFMLVLFWSCPELTTDRLLFNIVWTIWVVGATVLEERDLTEDFGDAYRDYQAKVPMLLPRKIRPSYSN
jgi:protein-S-isoprenylcysteine O-methyltransferase Ste14